MPSLPFINTSFLFILYIILPQLATKKLKISKIFSYGKNGQSFADD